MGSFDHLGVNRRRSGYECVLCGEHLGVPRHARITSILVRSDEGEWLRVLQREGRAVHTCPVHEQRRRSPLDVLRRRIRH